MGEYRVTSNLDSWAQKKLHALDVAMLDAATDVHRGALLLAPKLTGALKKSARIERVDPAHYIVSFGNKDRVPYAVRRHYENKKNPQTLRYLERSADTVKRGGLQKYLRG